MKDYDKHFAEFRKRLPQIAAAADHPLTEMLVMHNTQQRKRKFSIYRIFAIRQQSWMIDLRMAPLSFRELLAIEIARISFESMPLFTRIVFWVVALCVAGVPLVIAMFLHRTAFELYLGVALFAYIMLIFFTMWMHVTALIIQNIMTGLSIRVKPRNRIEFKALLKILFIFVCVWIAVYFSMTIIIGSFGNLKSILFLAALFYLFICIQYRRGFAPKQVEKQFENIVQECEPHYQKMEF